MGDYVQMVMISSYHTRRMTLCCINSAFRFMVGRLRHRASAILDYYAQIEKKKSEVVELISIYLYRWWLSNVV